jgi:hypothetical protein
MRPWIAGGALAAIAGGALRIADSFTAGVLAPGTLQVLYWTTDVLLLGGAAALWAARRASLGWAGTGGLAVFAAGILTIRLIGDYRTGAEVALLGLSLYSIEALVRRRDAAAAASWLIALAAGIAGALGVLPQAMTEAAGVAFGLGFVLAGIALLTQKKEGRAG